MRKGCLYGLACLAALALLPYALGAAAVLLGFLGFALAGCPGVN